MILLPIHRILISTVIIVLILIVLANRFLSYKVRMRLYVVVIVIALGIFAYAIIVQNYLPFQIELEPYLDGLDQPVYATFPPNDEERIFIVERSGQIQIVREQTIGDEPFLDISDQVATNVVEQGLLGLAFHPDYAQNGYFYVYHTMLDNNNTLVRYQVSADDPDRVDSDSRTTLLSIPKLDFNHNGGLLRFGPDNYLYLGLGDGGDEGNAWLYPSFAQDRSNLLGTIIRLDVSDPSGDPPYKIPADNPFIDVPDVRPEIWVYGLRNPWRYDFDASGEILYLTDVGSFRKEEINVLPVAEAVGANFGWRWYEGTDVVGDEIDSSAPPRSTLVFPAAEYDHSNLGGCSITGGYVYKGDQLPNLQDKYIYGDFCSGYIWSLTWESGGSADVDQIYRVENKLLTTFFEDPAGELYILTFDGEMLKIVP